MYPVHLQVNSDHTDAHLQTGALFHTNNLLHVINHLIPPLLEIADFSTKLVV